MTEGQRDQRLLIYGRAQDGKIVRALARERGVGVHDTLGLRRGP
jgi:hypothetical protein